MSQRWARSFGRTVVRAANSRAAGAIIAGGIGLGQAAARRMGLSNVKPKMYKKSKKSRTSTKRRRSSTKSRGGRRKQRRVKAPASMRGLLKRISVLEKKDKGETNTMCFRDGAMGSLQTAINECNYVGPFGETSTTFLGYLAALKYFDVNTPGTLLTVNAAGTTFVKNFRIQSSYDINVRNNYQVPIQVAIYAFEVVSDTSVNSYSAIDGLLTDRGITMTNDTMHSPMDVLTPLKEVYKLIRTTEKVLEPGGQLQLGHTGKYYPFDPAQASLRNATYLKKTGMVQFIIRIQGVVGHKSTDSTIVGFLQGGIDYHIRKEAKVQYDGGTGGLFFVDTETSYGALAALGVVSNKPVSDNQIYEVA